MNTYRTTDLNPPSDTHLEFDITNDSENYTVEVSDISSGKERLAAYHDCLRLMGNGKIQQK